MRRSFEALAGLIILGSGATATALEAPARGAAPPVPFQTPQIHGRNCQEGPNIGREVGGGSETGAVRATRCGVQSGTALTPSNQGQIDAAIVTETQGVLGAGGSAIARGR